MELIRPFGKLNKNNADLAGGKGASLGEMTQAGIPVPPGFVVLSAAFEKFIIETDLVQEIDTILHSVNHKEIHTVESASEQIKALITSVKMPDDIAEEIKKEFKKLDAKFVAVRSSATAEDSSAAAWAGQLESYLNTTENELIEKVQHCWASLFTPRAIFYRFEKMLHTTKISVAVVVQKMVESEISGIAFSVHPVTQDYNQLIIEAGLGLGEAIVSGQITPDSYVVEKIPRRIIDINVSTQERGLYKKEGGGNEWRDIPTEEGEKQVLTNDQILKLSELILKIENHYGFPCDIEWAYEKGKFYIVQSRPITTLTPPSTDEIKKNIDSGSEFDEFESYKFVQPFSRRSWGFYIYTVIRELAFPSDKKWRHSIGYIGNINDNLCTFRIFFKDDSSAYELLDKVSQNHQSLSDLENHGRNASESFLRQINHIDLKTLSNNELKKTFEVFFKSVSHACLLAIVCRVIDYAIIPRIKEILESKASNNDESLSILSFTDKKICVFEEEKEILKTAIKYTEGNFEQNELDDSIEALWKKYKLNTLGFFKEEPRSRDYYRETIKLLAPKAKELLSKLQKNFENNKNKRAELIKKLSLSESESKVIHVAGEIPYLKDVFKEVINSILYYGRPLFDEFMNRTKLSEDIAKNLTPDEINDSLDGKNINRQKIQDRIKHHVILGIEDKFGFYEGDKARSFEKRFLNIVETSDRELKGRTACRGNKKGLARVVLGSDDFHKVKNGDILVVGNTTPDYVVILGKVSAIVAEEGGITAHVSVISREMNIPAVVGIPNATIKIKDCDEVEVDADKGIVRILGSDKPIPEDFGRMFGGNSPFSYILSEGFLKYYNRLGVLCAQDEKSWTSFLPKKVKEETLKEGKELYTNKQKFEEYNDGFEEHKKRSSKEFESLLEKEKIEPDDIKKAMSLVAEHFSYYSKTEYFYTDSLDPRNMVIKEIEFDKLKQEGRVHLNKIAFQEAGYMRSLLEKISKQTDVPKMDLFNYSSDELIDLLKSGKKVDQSNIKDRAVFIMSEHFNVAGEMARPIVNEFVSYYKEVSDTIKGVTANKGKVTARAYVVTFDYKNFDSMTKIVNEMNKGDVLVTETTAPEIMPACKKASAIVANQGGRLSHAAIVSRELGIPGIINTDRDATVSIKTGDLLEVDADNGIVKILK